MITSGGLRDSLKLHFLVMIWGFTAVLGRLISIPSIEIVFYRTSIAALCLYILLKWRKLAIAMPRKDLIRILGIGMIIGAHWIFFFASARVSTVSVCLAGMATTSLWTSLVEPAYFKRRLYLHEILLSLLIIIGLYIVFHFEFKYWLGLTYAIISAFLAALFSVFNSEVSKKYNHHVITMYEMAGACVLTILFLPIYGSLITNNGIQYLAEGIDWVYILILAILCTVYAYSHYVELMKRLTPFAINIVMNMEPIYGIILAVIIFGDSEKMNTGFYFGTGIIMLSIFLYPFLNKKHQRKDTIPGMS